MQCLHAKYIADERPGHLGTRDVGLLLADENGNMHLRTLPTKVREWTKEQHELAHRWNLECAKLKAGNWDYEQPPTRAHRLTVLAMRIPSLGVHVQRLIEAVVHGAETIPEGQEPTGEQAAILAYLSTIGDALDV